MKTTVTASQARQELFKLMEQVTKAEGTDRVVIRRRGSPEGVALVRESYVRYLEERVEAAAAATPTKPFRLIGSGTVDGDVKEVIAEIRAEQNRLFEEKMKRMFSDN